LETGQVLMSWWNWDEIWSPLEYFLSLYIYIYIINTQYHIIYISLYIIVFHGDMCLFVPFCFFLPVGIWELIDYCIDVNCTKKWAGVTTLSPFQKNMVSLRTLIVHEFSMCHGLTCFNQLITA
jgi:disulfide bond formation protein DsbB